MLAARSALVRCSPVRVVRAPTSGTTAATANVATGGATAGDASRAPTSSRLSFPLRVVPPPRRYGACDDDDDNDGNRKNYDARRGDRLSGARRCASGQSFPPSSSPRVLSPPVGESDDRRRPFSSRASSTTADGGGRKAPSSAASLRRLIRPFLVACHPDAMAGSLAPDGSGGDGGGGIGKTDAEDGAIMSRAARDTNLRAVQRLNGLVDAIDDLIDRCHGGGVGDARTVPELNGRYEIEFIIPSTKEDPTAARKKKRGGPSTPILTRRSVTIEFPEELRDDARRGALGQPPRRPRTRGGDDAGKAGIRTATELKRRAQSELVRILRVAGMDVPPSILLEMNEDYRAVAADSGGDGGTSGGEGIENSERPPSSSTLRSRPPPARSHVQEERERFMNSIDWTSYRRDFDRALDDARADVATHGMVSLDPERKQQFVADVVGRVRVAVGGNDDSDGAEEGRNRDPDARLFEGGLDAIHQLIALRRLSLILNDNFDHLQLEEMGRMWERLTIVLTPERGWRSAEAPQNGGRRHKKEDNDTALVTRKRRNREGRAPESRGQMMARARDESPAADTPEKKRRGRDGGGGESGFKFSYGASGDGGRVTAYVPADFGDDELVAQFHRHLYEYYDFCVVSSLEGEGGGSGSESDGKMTVDEGLHAYMRRFSS